MPTLQNRRFPPPWRVRRTPAAYCVEDAGGFPIVHVYFEARSPVGTGPDNLTPDQARRIALNIAKLPELLRTAR